MVLLDVEWIEISADIRYITQIAAVRVNDNWEREEEISLLVRSMEAKWYSSGHMGLGGYPAEVYLSAPGESDALGELLRWLRPKENLCFWHYESILVLQEACKRVLGCGVKHVAYCANKGVAKAVSSLGIKAGNPYRIAELLGLEPPAIEHRASNDVEVLCDLLTALATKKEDLKSMARPNAQPKKPKRKKMNDEEMAAAKRRYLLDGSPCQYFYTKGSKVFHTRSCRVIHAIKNIEGCLRYHTAANGRTPCKLCHPVAPAPAPASKKEETEKIRRNSEVIRARMLGGDTIEIKRGKLVGCCHNIIHPGKMNRALLEQHDCLGKGCPFFEKYPESGYWHEQERQAKMREARKKERRESREAALAKEGELEKVKASFQACADETQSNMDIIRVEKSDAGVYTVYYVSDNPFADGNRFQPFTSVAAQRHHCKRIQLKHIRGVDGRFVTRVEYRQRKRK